MIPGTSSALVEGVIAYSDYTMNMRETTTNQNQMSNIGGFNVGLSVTNFFGDDRLKYGMEMEGNTTRTAYKINDTITDYSTEIGLYAIYKLLYRSILLEPSLRLNYYASLGNIFLEPRLSAKWNITKKFRLKLATGVYSQTFLDTKSDRDIVNLFTGYMTVNPDLNIVEMDTVEGLKEESDCFLTLFWRKSKFMLIFKLESQTTEEVTRIFKILQQLIPYDDYKKLFQVILTDNGHEFYDVQNIECMHSTGEYVTKLFFCDPHMSCQKGMLEKNHEFIRYILPKGSSFKNITQEDCDLFMNNINSISNFKGEILRSYFNNMLPLIQTLDDLISQYGSDLIELISILKENQDEINFPLEEGRAIGKYLKSKSYPIDSVSIIIDAIKESFTQNL